MAFTKVTTGGLSQTSNYGTHNINSTGIVTAIKFVGDGSELDGVSSAGIGSALDEDSTKPLNLVYYTNSVLGIGSTMVVNHPDTTNCAYTAYTDIKLEGTADLIVEDGDDLVVDILGISSEGVPAISGTGGRVRAGEFTNTAGNASPLFPKGVRVTGVVTATSFTGNVTGNLSGDIVGTRTLGTGVTVTSAGIVSATQYYGSAVNLTSIPGANITGTIPLSSLSLIDLASVRKDISALALQTAVDTNRVAYNLPNSLVDQFENDIGIGASTGISRNTSGEYFSSVWTAEQQYVADSNTLALMHCNGSNADTSGTGFEDSSGNNRDWTRASASNSMPQVTTTAGDFKYTSAMNWASGTANNGNSVRWPDADWQHFCQGAADWTIEFWFVSHNQTFDYEQGELFGKATSNSTDSTGGIHLQVKKDTGNAGQNYFWFNIYKVNGSSTSDDWNMGSNSTTQFPLNTLTHCAVVRDGATVRMYVNGVQKDTHNIGAGNPILTGTANRLAGDIWCGRRAYNTTYGRFEGSVDEYRISDVCRYPNGTTFTPNTQSYDNATGICTSKVNTPSSARTKVSGVMLYKDAAGTNVLGTDLKASFTCNGGTNWTQVGTYTTASNFSTGINTIYLGEATCTSGTDVRYKVEWANQANGSKVAQLHGMALNY